MKLPVSAKVNKFIPKTQFYNRLHISKKLKDDFINKIQKITWQYKLSEDTINTSKTKKVEEIQIFHIELKEKSTPKNILQTIDKVISYPILFVITFEDEFQYVISLKEKGVVNGYYFSEWNEKIDFDFTGVNLEKVYQKIIKNFIKEVSKKEKNFDDIIKTDNQIKELKINIQKLESKLSKEKQFNKKVELNKDLIFKRKEFERIINDNK